MPLIEWNAKRVRQTFLDFFCSSKGHTFIPSSAVVPHADPTLLFANSGMTQFKPIFQGTIDPASPLARISRAANTQKCIRAGGKHNDLDDVGKDTYHHTFFEMLGNWSFGAYFKQGAIEMAWELLTKVYALPPSRLYVTYFGGNEQLNLPADLEARDIWLAMGLPSNHVIPYGMKENFWEMGETGPCGPCSEIHFDRIGGGRDASALVNADDPDVLEIWNLVFMQFNREPDASLRPLPMKHIDTGMGFERLVSVLQDKRSNYDTDVFEPIFRQIQLLTSCPAYEGKVGAADVNGIDTAYRVVADHIRTLVVAISDGGVPSNEGRGYVLRRILRRGVRYAYEKLGAQPGFFAALVDVVVGQLGEVFEQVQGQVELCKQILMQEESQFRKTLDRGIIQFSRYSGCLDDKGRLRGDDAWRLFDTFGFPLDLTKLMAEERGITVDEAGYAAAQERAREVSRRASSNADEAAAAIEDLDLNVHELALLKDLPSTDDEFKYAHGESCSVEGAKVLALWQKEGGFVEKIDCSAPFIAILSKTCIYAEQGGQMSDTGSIEVEGESFSIASAKLRAGLVLHICPAEPSNSGSGLSKGATVTVSFCPERRKAIRLNHTATHLLNFAIRKITKQESDQKGSLVAPEKLRFDFVHNEPVSEAEITQITDLINSEMIAKNLTVYCEEISLKEASEIKGIRMVFGETYPDPVRVVSIGADLKQQVLKNPQSEEWLNYAIELCGGTHSQSLAELGTFIITQETTKAKGTRRIFAVTGEEAVKAEAKAEELQNALNASAALTEDQLKALSKQLDEATISCTIRTQLRSKLQARRQELDDACKALKAAQVKAAETAVRSTLAEATNAPFIVMQLEQCEGNPKALANSASILKAAGKTGLLYCITQEPEGGKKLWLNAVVQETHVAKMNAVEWLSAIAAQVMGEQTKCGGRDGAAQGSGNCCEGVGAERVHEVAASFAALRL